MEYTEGVKRLESAAIEIAGDIGFLLSGAATGGGRTALPATWARRGSTDWDQSAGWTIARMSTF